MDHNRFIIKWLIEIPVPIEVMSAILLMDSFGANPTNPNYFTR
jgi:hypothetical protein